MASVGYFGDIGKATNDLLGRDFNYDHKLSIGNKTDSGLTVTLNGAKKGSGVSGDIKGSFERNGVTVDTTVTSDSKVSTTLNFDIAKGIKGSISGSIPDKASGKLSLSLKQPHIAVKSSMGLNTTPKIDASICTGMNNAMIGADVGYDTAKSAMTKYNFGAGLDASDFSVALFLLDKGDTVKASYNHKMGGGASVGAEVLRKLSKSETTFTVGGMAKLDGGATGKVKVDNHGICSMLYQQEIRPKTVATLSAQFDMKTLDKNAKVGVNLAIKP